MDFVVYAPQNEKTGEKTEELKVLVWRHGGMTRWADVTDIGRDAALDFMMEVAREEAAEQAARLGHYVQPAAKLLAEGCDRCSPDRPCGECLSTSPDIDEWAHLPGWWERVDLPELREEVILARTEGVRQGQAPSVVAADLEDVFTSVRRRR